MRLQMVEWSEGRKEYRVFRSIPEIGDSTACRLIGELGDIRRFQNTKQLNAYAGIDIMRYQCLGIRIIETGLINEETSIYGKFYISWCVPCLWQKENRIILWTIVIN